MAKMNLKTKLFYLAFVIFTAGNGTLQAAAPDRVAAAKWCAFGTDLLGQGKVDDAVISFKRSLEFGGGNKAALKGLGDCYYEKGDMATATKYYEAAKKVGHPVAESAPEPTQISTPTPRPFSKVKELTDETKVTAHKAIFDISIFGGQTTLSMKAVNAKMDQTIAETKLYGGFCGVPTKILGGTYVGVDGSWNIWKGLKVGPRIELIKGEKGGDDRIIFGQKEDWRVTPSLIPLMVGASLEHRHGKSKRFGGQVSLHLGYALANALFERNIAGAKDSENESGSGLVAELNGNLNYRIFKHFSLGIELGYRLASISNMKSDVTGMPDPVVFDYSGLIAGARVGLNF